jgi:hypothetical protein
MGLYQRSAPGSERYGPALPVRLHVYNKHPVANNMVGVHVLKYLWFAVRRGSITLRAIMSVEQRVHVVDSEGKETSLGVMSFAIPAWRHLSWHSNCVSTSVASLLIAEHHFRTAQRAVRGPPVSAKAVREALLIEFVRI